MGDWPSCLCCVAPFLSFRFLKGICLFFIKVGILTRLCFLLGGVFVWTGPVACERFCLQFGVDELVPAGSKLNDLAVGGLSLIHI